MNSSVCMGCPQYPPKTILETVHKPEGRLLFLIDHPSEEDIPEAAVFSSLTYRSAALWKLCIDAKLEQKHCVVDTVLRCVITNKAAVTGNTYLQCLSKHIDDTLAIMPIRAILAFGDIPAQHLLQNYTKTAEGLRNTERYYNGVRVFATYPLSTLTETGCSACNTNIRKTLMHKDLRAAYDYAMAVPCASV